MHTPYQNYTAAELLRLPELQELRDKHPIVDEVCNKLERMKGIKPNLEEGPCRT